MSVRVIFSRAVVCYRWAWRPAPFVQGLGDRLLGLWVIAKALIGSVVALPFQVLSVIVYPVWSLIAQPLLVAMRRARYSDKRVDMLAKILDRDGPVTMEDVYQMRLDDEGIEEA